MTNKTITLDRELVSRIVGLRPDYTCAQLDADEELVRAALADPVPPAGGDVETVATMYVALRDHFQSFVCPAHRAEQLRTLIDKQLAIWAIKDATPVEAQAEATNPQPIGEQQP